MNATISATPQTLAGAPASPNSPEPPTEADLELWDANGDGYLSDWELLNYQWNKPAGEDLFGTWHDPDGDGKMSLAELQEAWELARDPGCAFGLPDGFSSINGDINGEVTLNIWGGGEYTFDASRLKTDRARLTVMRLLAGEPVLQEDLNHLASDAGSEDLFEGRTDSEVWSALVFPKNATIDT